MNWLLKKTCLYCRYSVSSPSVSSPSVSSPSVSSPNFLATVKDIELGEKIIHCVKDIEFDEKGAYRDR